MPVSRAMNAPDDVHVHPTQLRGVSELWRFRGRRAVVIVCRDDAHDWERHRPRFAALEAELVLERDAGALSAALGRPMVVVCDRYLDATSSGAALEPEAVTAELRFLSCRCEECPQAMHEPGGDAWAG
jgi:hypothetical protein